jgi:hypothetical protein
MPSNKSFSPFYPPKFGYRIKKYEYSRKSTAEMVRPRFAMHVTQEWVNNPNLQSHLSINAWKVIDCLSNKAS